MTDDIGASDVTVILEANFDTGLRQLQVLHHKLSLEDRNGADTIERIKMFRSDVLELLGLTEFDLARVAQLMVNLKQVETQATILRELVELLAQVETHDNVEAVNFSYHFRD